MNADCPEVIFVSSAPFGIVIQFTDHHGAIIDTKLGSIIFLILESIVCHGWNSTVFDVLVYLEIGQGPLCRIPVYPALRKSIRWQYIQTDHETPPQLFE